MSSKQVGQRDLSLAATERSVGSGYGASKFYGENVEEAICGDPQRLDKPLYDDIYLERARTYDARRTRDKGKVQIKACQEWVSNGPNKRRRGRFRVWWDQLEDCQEFIFVVYDPTTADGHPIQRVARGPTERVQALTPDDPADWYDSGHQTKRGSDRFYWLNWRHVFDGR